MYQDIELWFDNMNLALIDGIYRVLININTDDMFFLEANSVAVGKPI
jgi:hypothetical protein